MNENTLRALRFIAENGGDVPVYLLRTVPGFNPRIVGALCSGESPNCRVSGSRIAITVRGRGTVQRYRFRQLSDAPEVEMPNQPEEESETVEAEDSILENLFSEPVPEPQQTPNVTHAEPESGKVDIIDLVINRNKNIEISCKLSKSFAEWLIAHGSTHNFVTIKGITAASSWGCGRDTKFIDANLGSMEMRSDNVITPTGINPMIIKLAAAQQDRTWKAVHKGLISKEDLLRAGEDLKVKMTQFYLNFIKPIKIHVQLSVIE